MDLIIDKRLNELERTVESIEYFRDFGCVYHIDTDNIDKIYDYYSPKSIRREYENPAKLIIFYRSCNGEITGTPIDNFSEAFDYIIDNYYLLMGEEISEKRKKTIRIKLDQEELQVKEYVTLGVLKQFGFESFTQESYLKILEEIKDFKSNSEIHSYILKPCGKIKISEKLIVDGKSLLPFFDKFTKIYDKRWGKRILKKEEPQYTLAEDIKFIRSFNPLIFNNCVYWRRRKNLYPNRKKSYIIPTGPVTSVARQISKPGRFLSTKSFKKIQYEDEFILYDIFEENINAILIGLATDYLTRFILDGDKEEAFSISLIGAGFIGYENSDILLKNIKGLDDESITNACKLVGYDVVFRAGPCYYKSVEYINPNKETIHNIRIMVNRTVDFLKKEEWISNGFLLSGGKYVKPSDFDYLCKKSLWDLKVSKKQITTTDTLQILMYYLMGINAKGEIREFFDRIETIGFFNPRLNLCSLIKVEEISEDVKEKVKKDVIGIELKEE